MKEIEIKLASYKSKIANGVKDFSYTKDNNFIRIKYSVGDVSCVDFIEVKPDWVADYEALISRIDNLLSKNKE